jgi:hypothetical protein
MLIRRGRIRRIQKNGYIRGRRTGVAMCHLGDAHNWRLIFFDLARLQPLLPNQKKSPNCLGLVIPLTAYATGFAIAGMVAMRTRTAVIRTNGK